ncbi:hypothetical protein LAZ67_3006145 [Cordylochernes scorpioides]|uniref:Reverse transcriptase domain-containing protein n=1 Tax=Cordylochernes scorpioides TaxID=51811 RepID=A0ABY6KC11_9ARAC|nr:hypothetical protein LAZ67_3006145 [Cordylochernes scorpioides]
MWPLPQRVNQRFLLPNHHSTLAAKIKLKADQIKQNKWIELCSSIDPKTSDTKLWRLLHALNQDTPSHSSSNTFKDYSGNPLTDKYSIANHFAHHYSSTAKLNFNLQDKIIGRKSRLTRSLAKSKPSHNIFSKPFQDHELDEALSHLDPTKAPGPDNITGPMLKNLSSHAKLELLSIFNYSWSSSTLPKEWKHATIIPIHKPGKLENHPTNYRPISLTSIPCKIMEHMILNRLTFYLNLSNLLDPHQRAFKKYQSTEDSIFYFVQQIQDSFHHKPTESTIAAFIDLSQAFDRVWKEKLILKFDELGIEGKSKQAQLKLSADFEDPAQIALLNSNPTFFPCT